MQWKVVIFVSRVMFLPVFSSFCAKGQSWRWVHVQALVPLSSMAKEQVYWLYKRLLCVTITRKSTAQWSAGESSISPSMVPKTLLCRLAISTKCQSSPAASVTSNYKKRSLNNQNPLRHSVKPSPAFPLKLLLIRKWGNSEKMVLHARNSHQRNPIPNCPFLASSSFF